MDSGPDFGGHCGRKIFRVRSWRGQRGGISDFAFGLGGGAVVRLITYSESPSF